MHACSWRQERQAQALSLIMQCGSACSSGKHWLPVPQHDLACSYTVTMHCTEGNIHHTLTTLTPATKADDKSETSMAYILYEWHAHQKA